MSGLNPLGIGRHPHRRDDDQRSEIVLPRRVLHRILDFTGQSIHDVINDPIAKNMVLGYYKLHRQVERACEAVELERQWNPTGRRT